MIRPGTRAPLPAKKPANAPRQPKRRLPQIDQRIAALAAAGAVAAVVFGAIQVFGDPSAAGPVLRSAVASLTSMGMLRPVTT